MNRRRTGLLVLLVIIGVLVAWLAWTGGDAGRLVYLLLRRLLGALL